MFARFGCVLVIKNVAKPSENVILRAKHCILNAFFHQIFNQFSPPRGPNPRVLRVPALENDQNSRISAPGPRDPPHAQKVLTPPQTATRKYVDYYSGPVH